MRLIRPCIAIVALFSAAASAQFNPAAGEWLKDDPSHIRVMTWNVGDNLVADQPKSDGFNDWSALVRIVAGLEPDILLLQEAADNNGADSIPEVEQTIDAFLNGGPGVGVWVRQVALSPDYDLPFAYILSGATDGFNRNIILSRFPIEDINGDGLSSADDFTNRGDLWAPGGGGGIRGFSWAEINLPDEIYLGDLVVANSHLKAFGDCGSYNQRISAAQNISYFIEFYWNGGGTGETDPRDEILFPSADDPLGPSTPVIWGGDWNNRPDFTLDVCGSGDRNPIEWMIEGDVGGGNGPDRDGTDALRDFAVVPGSNGDDSTQSGSKLDYIGWQDSIATAVNEFIFNTSSTSFPLPEPIATGERPTLLSGVASDHRPVIVDFVLPEQTSEGPPVITQLDVTPDPLAFTDTFTIEARVFDPDGSILGDVQFFEDTNSNGVFNEGLDQQIGAVTPADPGGTSDVVLTTTPADFITQDQFDALIGTDKTFFVRAADGMSSPATVESTAATLINLPPQAAGFSALPTTLGIADTASVTVDAIDEDGAVATVELFFDSNDNFSLDEDDQLIASRAGNGTGAATLSADFTPGDALTTEEFNDRIGGGNGLFAKITDDKGGEQVSSLGLTFADTPPIVTLALDPNPLPPTGSGTLTVTADDPDAGLDLLTVVIDDGDGVVEFFGDQLILSASEGGTFTATISASDLAPGPNTILAQAISNDSVITVESLTVETEPCPFEFDGEAGIDGGDLTAYVQEFADNPDNPRLEFNDQPGTTLGDLAAFTEAFNAGDFPQSCQ